MADSSISTPSATSACNGFCHGDNVVKDEQVRDQMVVLDHLSPFIARVLRQEASTIEGYPLHKKVERLAFVRRRLNCSPEIDVGYVLEEKRRSGPRARVREIRNRACSCGSTWQGTAGSVGHQLPISAVVLATSSASLQVAADVIDVLLVYVAAASGDVFAQREQLRFPCSVRPWRHVRR